jgi:hypothetical protein
MYHKLDIMKLQYISKYHQKLQVVSSIIVIASALSQSPLPSSAALLPATATATAPHPSIEQPQCDNSLWKHVFLPTRLHILNPCITTTGIIESIHVENDGDFHIKLLADNRGLINQANIKFENGDLVLEAICQNPVSRPEVGGACDNFNHPPLSIPPVGSHITVTGSYVLDTRNNNWAEIHPVTSIARIQR